MFMLGLHTGKKHVTCLGKPRKYYISFLNILNFFFEKSYLEPIHPLSHKTLTRALKDE